DPGPCRSGHVPQGLPLVRLTFRPRPRASRPARRASACILPEMHALARRAGRGGTKTRTPPPGSADPLIFRFRAHGLRKAGHPQGVRQPSVGSANRAAAWMERAEAVARRVSAPADGESEAAV